MDADHCGASGYYAIPACVHPVTSEIIKKKNRAYGSRSEGSILEAFYTKMINLFSRFRPPLHPVLFRRENLGQEGIFPVIDTITIDGIRFDVLESLGGHMAGQIFLFSRDHGLLFTADSIINFKSLSQERSEYNSLADFLVTSVNVDSDLAREERAALLQLIATTDSRLQEMGKRCLVCGGHRAVSVLDKVGLVPFGAINHYKPPIS